jgi:hypothetical protein
MANHLMSKVDVVMSLKVESLTLGFRGHSEGLRRFCLHGVAGQRRERSAGNRTVSDSVGHTSGFLLLASVSVNGLRLLCGTSQPLKPCFINPSILNGIKGGSCGWHFHGPLRIIPTRLFSAPTSRSIGRQGSYPTRSWAARGRLFQTADMVRNSILSDGMYDVVLGHVRQRR